MKERKHAGGRPKKACFTYKDGKVVRHEDIPTAAKFLGVSGAPGSYIRVMLNLNEAYRPRSGGVCWEVSAQVPEEATEAMAAWSKEGSR